MKKNEHVAAIMTTDVKSVQVEQKISDVRRIFAENAIHHVPVLRGREPVGIVTTHDMMEISFDAFGVDRPTVDSTLDHQFKLEEVMSRALITLNPDDTIHDAATELATGEYHSVLIVDDRNHLQGIVTSTDLIQYLVDQF